MTLPEVLLWRALRQRPDGLKFRKQHPVGDFVLDFFCAKANLCVEVDGEAHNRGDQPAFDADRDAWLRLHDIFTLRISAREVFANLEDVVTQIVTTCIARTPHHHSAAPSGPSPRAGEVQKSTP